MKKYFYFLLFISISGFSLGQYKTVACGFTEYVGMELDELSNMVLCLDVNGIYAEEGQEEVLNYIDQILEQVGLFRNFDVLGCLDIHNAFAITLPDLNSGNMYRFIIYDNHLFEEMNETTNSEWGTFAVLAHEIGHHLNGHTLTVGGSLPPTELQADEFAGFALAKAGGNMEEVKAAYLKIMGEKGSETHPPLVERYAALDRGWNRAMKTMTPINREPASATELLQASVKNLGGEEAIKKIKYLGVSRVVNFKSLMEGQPETVSEQVLWYYKPSQYHLQTNQDGRRGEQVRINQRIFRPDSYGNWSEDLLFGKKTLSGNGNFSANYAPASYVEEYSLLINNPPMKFGTEKMDGKSYYCIELPEKVFINSTTNEVRTVKETRYYDSQTKLPSQVITVETSSNPIIPAVVSKVVYSDYKNVNGVYFPFNENRYTQINNKMTGHTEFKIQEINSNTQLMPMDFLLLMRDLENKGKH